MPLIMFILVPRISYDIPLKVKMIFFFGIKFGRSIKFDEALLLVEIKADPK